MPLSSAEAREFFDRGFLVLRGAFAARAVARMSNAFDALEERASGLDETTLLDGSLYVVKRLAPERLRIERIVWCGGSQPILGKLGRSPRLVNAAASLLGIAEIDQLVNQAHIKNPGDGLEFRFHQDSYHRRYGTELFTDVNGKGSFVQTLTAVDAMAPDNGGLWVVPESHRGGHIPTRDGRIPEGAFERERAVPVILSAGDVLLLGPFTVHGSGPNQGSTPRRLFINGFCCAGANRREYPGAGVGFRVRGWNRAA